MDRNQKKFASWGRLLVPALWMGVIFVASHRSLPGEINLPIGTDKLIHMAVFGMLAAGWLFAMAPKPISPTRKALLAIGLSVAWGVLDEWHQSFVSGRTSSVADLFADGLGSVLVVSAWKLKGAYSGGAAGGRAGRQSSSASGERGGERCSTP